MPKNEERVYIAIDMKSFYASVECVYRQLDPLKAHLLVADESRSDQTICLAVSPALKAKGVPSRPRLFEAKQAIQQWERTHHEKLPYIIAVPRMAEYERVSSLIYSICIRYVAPCDIHVYSIDESFIDCTPYLHFYREKAEKTDTHPARVMAMTIIRDILKTTKITATVGIGTNLYLAKIAMDIVAKKAQPDADGVRIAELNEDSYKYLLWDHTPLTDFWMLGPGKAKRLQKAYIFTMGDVAARSQYDMEWFYKTFGIDGEILVDHAWGVERVTMADIKSYHTDHHSLSNGQVLPRPYHCGEARNVLHEMIDALAYDMYKKKLAAQSFTWWVSYDHKSLQKVPDYTGPVVTDDYGRLHPEHDNGSVKTRIPTNSPDMIASAILRQFDTLVDDRLLFRRLGVCANGVQNDDGVYQLDMFTDYGAVEREKRIQAALMEVRKKYGPNALLKGNNFMEGATMRERNEQIGGHRR